MLTQQQSDAKSAARELCSYPSRLIAEKENFQIRERLPRLQPGIEGYGIADDAVRIYISKENPDIEIPENLNGFQVETISTQGFKAQATSGRVQRAAIPCGVSIGHKNTGAGTLGCLLDCAGDRYMLSNNHVFVHNNSVGTNDEILQPASIDGTNHNPAHPIGYLEDFEPIDFSGVNHIDAAIASIIDNTSVTADIMTLGFPASSPIAASYGTRVVKHGRTTGLTFGTIVDVSFNGLVTYVIGGQHTSAWFENQIVVDGSPTQFSDNGDSGSLILDSPDLHPIGLLFAGDGTVTLANPINLVLNRFAATILGR